MAGSLTERWLTSAHERPFRLFFAILGIWLIAIFVLGFAGCERRTWADRPPDARAISYADYLPGGPRVAEGTLALAPDAVPAFDATRVEARAIGFHMHMGSGPNQPRLAWGAMTDNGSFGWPKTLVTWNAVKMWDVTDPTASFPALGGYWRSYDLWHRDAVSLGWANANRSWCLGVRILWPALGMEMMLGLGATLIGVVVPRTWSARRRRCRLRRGACAQCGYPQRGANGHCCPECGMFADQ